MPKIIFYEESRPDPSQQQEVLYLPGGTGLELMSFGYQKALSHLIWFKTISYFAKHYRQDRNYKWLSHMCELVTRLNPDALYMFQFCGVMLAWEGNMPNQAVSILSSAIKAHPDNWLFPYLRGFVYAFFLHDEEKAKDDFIYSSKQQGAHPIVTRLASKKILSLDNPESALEFLGDAIKNTSDPKTKEVLTDRLKEVYYEIGFRFYEQALDSWRSQRQTEPDSLDDLTKAGLVPEEYAKGGYKDIYGGHYYYDRLSKSILSSSRHKRDSLHWKRKSNQGNE